MKNEINGGKVYQRSCGR